MKPHYPYEAGVPYQRYWRASTQRQNPNVFWNGRYVGEETPRWGPTSPHAGYRRGRHKTQEWWCGERYVTIHHWTMKDLRG